MTFITTIAASEADGDVKTMYQQLQGNKNYLPNYASAYCYRPALMGAWSDLQKTFPCSSSYTEISSNEVSTIIGLICKNLRLR